MLRPSSAPLRRVLRRPSRGFNLIQLVIALAMVSILTAIAYPAYRDHLVRGKATEATAALAEGQHRMEQYFLGERTYVGGPCQTSQTVSSFTVACPSSGTGKPSTTGYVIFATGTGATSGLTYTIDQTGAQRTTAVPSGWPTVPTGGHACWLMRKNGAC